MSYLMLEVSSWFDIEMGGKIGCAMKFLYISTVHIAYALVSICKYSALCSYLFMISFYCYFPINIDIKHLLTITERATAFGWNSLTIRILFETNKRFTARSDDLLLSERHLADV